MPKDRYIGIDAGKGFAIFAMVLVHVLVQQIGQKNAEVFASAVEKASIVDMILLAPIALLSVMGTGFHYLNAVSISIQMLRLANQKPEKLPASLKQRVISSFLFIILYKITQAFITPEYFRIGSISLPSISIIYTAEAVETIAISAILLSLVLFFIFTGLKIRNPKYIFWIFLGLTVLWFSLSNPMVSWGQSAIVVLHEKELYFLEFVVSKFAVGRFKLFQTLGISFVAVSFACLMTLDVSIRKIVWFALFLLCLTLGILLILIYFDSGFLQEFASEEVPLPFVIFSSGGESVMFVYFIAQCDYGTPEKQTRSAKRMAWFRRYGAISLTIFSIHAFVNNIIFNLFIRMWGPTIDNTGETPQLNWNWMQMAALILATMLIWEILLRLWQKTSFKFSLEWIIMRITRTERLKHDTRNIEPKKELKTEPEPQIKSDLNQATTQELQKPSS